MNYAWLSVGGCVCLWKPCHSLFVIHYHLVSRYCLTVCDECRVESGILVTCHSLYIITYHVIALTLITLSLNTDRRLPMENGANRQSITVDVCHVPTANNQTNKIENTTQIHE